MAREYTPKYIRREVWKRITSVIKDYRQLKAEYTVLSDRTENNYTLTRENELKRKLSAFETAYNSADEETKEIVRQHFWERRIYRDIPLPVSESTMKRYVRKFVLDVGRNLGEID